MKAIFLFKPIYLICLAIFVSSGMHAEVKLSALFSDNMVLQRDAKFSIWGTADKGENVSIAFNNVDLKTKADKAGNWTIDFKPMVFGGPYSMIIKGKNNAITISNILIGDVWVCSGQSNMQFTVNECLNAKDEIASANYPLIRSFNVAQEISMAPKSDFKGSWNICNPETVGDFTAVGYFFARKIYQETGVPIGIINSSWGGTDIETWTSSNTFNKLPDNFKERYKDIKIDDLDLFVEQNRSKKDAYVNALKNDFGFEQKWFDTSFGEVDWETIKVPSLWSKTVLKDIDGYVWFKQTITLPADVADKAGELSLGAIDDADIVWINGIKVGETAGYNIKRFYKIPAGVLKAGENTLTVRITDYSGDGGIYGQENEIQLSVNNRNYPLAGNWKYKQSVTNELYSYVDVTPNTYPSLLYNAMINPMINYAIKGVIWYQGENNASEAFNYRTLFPNMIKDWRNKWKHEFPFYWVQLANFFPENDNPVESDWAELREAQTMTLALLKTGQAVTIDIGEALDIHPRNKQDVGVRLALAALNNDYGFTDLVYSGPTYKSMQVDGNKIILEFDNIGSKLDVYNKYGYVQGFTIAGPDKKFVWANAIVKDNKVIVYSNQIQAPVAVRYNWANNPDGNLYNSEGLPTVPFRTDSWKGTTEH